LKLTKKNIGKTFKSTLQNYWFILIFVACVGFVGIVSLYKLFVKRENFVYAKVKVSQGLWWASTQRAPVWFIPALKKGLVENSLVGQPSARITKVTYYPYYTASQYDIYLVLRLRVTGNQKTGTYNYNRSALAVGSPIEFAFPGAEFSGTVLALSARPFKPQFVWKTITLVKPSGYQWEYDAIKVGDKYHNGEQTVLEVLDKSTVANPLYGSDGLGTYGERSVFGLYPEPRQFITVRLKAKVQNTKQNYVFGEEQELRVGKPVNLSTNNFYFQDFQVMSIE